MSLLWIVLIVLLVLLLLGGFGYSAEPGLKALGRGRGTVVPASGSAQRERSTRGRDMLPHRALSSSHLFTCSAQRRPSLIAQTTSD